MWAVGGIHAADPWGKGGGNQNKILLLLKDPAFELGNFNTPPTHPPPTPRFHALYGITVRDDLESFSTNPGVGWGQVGSSRARAAGIRLCES